jgi:hypothetical protein
VDLPSLPEDATRTGYRYTFKEWNNDDVLSVCRQYLKEIKRIVADGLQRGFLAE